jgi:hypothetical protein
MNITDITSYRLQHQQIATTKFKKAKDIVSWMGVMQAQDYPMSKWAVGIRLPSSTENTIETAIHKGEIIRTHILRPTWHLTAAEDIYWLLALSAPKLKASLKSRLKELELTAAVLKKCNAVIEKALIKDGHLTRDELIKELKKAKIAVNNYRSSHIFFWAEMEGLICSGCLKEKEPTYTLLQEWVPKKKELAAAEAAALLAQKYFNSHGPATLADFVWWSNLNISVARQGLNDIQHQLQSAKIGGQTYYMPASLPALPKRQKSVYLLPAFDEYIISYKDRSAMYPGDLKKHAISNNGFFRPVIVVNGQVVGIWKRGFEKRKMYIEAKYFTMPPIWVHARVNKAGKAYGAFLNQKTEVIQSELS